MMVMLIDENWAVAITRIEAFFVEQPDVSSHINGYRYGDCTITLIPIEPQNDAPFALPRTRIIIEGPDDEVRVIHRRFFLRFLSAGG